MNIEQKIIISNSNTPELEIINKIYEFIYTSKPQEKDGFQLEEWIEEKDTQIINHWNYVPINSGDGA